jgi:thiol-disulfide isomerase/thioredoxin
MNKFVLIATLLVLSTAVSAAGKYKKKNGVLILTDKNFDAAVAEFPNLFVKFYAPWCPHCKKIAPKWEKLAKEYAQQEDGVVFAKMNAEKNPDTANNHEVRIIKLFLRIKILNFSHVFTP